MKSNVEELCWDSAFFSKRIGTVTNVDTVTVDELNNFELITNKVESFNYSQLNKFTQLGFNLAEGELLFSKKLTDLSNDERAILLAQKEDISELINLAETSYVSTRFRQPWFTKEQSSRFYGTWIEKAVLGEFDDVCIVIKDKGLIQGFVSLRKVNTELKIGLIGVAQTTQGKGIARKLLALTETYAYKHQCNQITVATQTGNIKAINLYTRNNYSLKESNYWLYKTHL